MSSLLLRRKKPVPPLQIAGTKKRKAGIYNLEIQSWVGLISVIDVFQLGTLEDRMVWLHDHWGSMIFKSALMISLEDRYPP